MKRIALSIDTDFFVREKMEWDFGLNLEKRLNHFIVNSQEK